MAEGMRSVPIGYTGEGQTVYWDHGAAPPRLSVPGTTRPIQLDEMKFEGARVEHVDLRGASGTSRGREAVIEEARARLEVVLSIMSDRYRRLDQDGSRTWDQLGGGADRIHVVVDEYAALAKAVGGDDLDDHTRDSAEAITRIIGRLLRESRSAGISVHLTGAVPAT